MAETEVVVIGGGLAGCEAAFQLAKQGHEVRLLEMRPVHNTRAHQTDGLGELVCTNSFKSEDPCNAHGQLKREMLAARAATDFLAWMLSVGIEPSLELDEQGPTTGGHEVGRATRDESVGAAAGGMS